MFPVAPAEAIPPAFPMYKKLDAALLTNAPVPETTLLAKNVEPLLVKVPFTVIGLSKVAVALITTVKVLPVASTKFDWIFREAATGELATW